ncbi:uncharacterized protein VTP21DRAFT_6257 [Calcarisporiella thermophila]|uniref:uncharacterized protein n=1 Tax=Calcarisporiella thermophila TaxID=911321 RepID=UPI0037448DC1
MNPTQSLLSSHPNFAALYRDLRSRHITPTGVSQSLKTAPELNELKHHKREYLETLSLYEAILEMASASHGALDIQLRRIAGAIDRVIMSVETSQCLSNPIFTGASCTLLGLKENEVEDAVKADKEVVEKAKEYILERIEESLQKKCESIALFHFGKLEEATNSKLLVAKASQLPSLLGAKLEENTAVSSEFSAKRVQLAENITQYVNVLAESLSILWTLITEYKNKHTLTWNRVYDNYYSCMIDSTFLKLKSLKLTILMSIYDAPTRAALSILREAMAKKESELQHQLDSVDVQLAAYEGAGDEFRALLDEYFAITEELEKVADDVRRMMGVS